MPFWFLLSLSAAVLWGFQYSSYGAKLTTIPVTVFTFYYAGVAIISAVVVLSVNPISSLVVPRAQWGWMASQLVVGAIASLLIAKSIQAQNASQASMVEIAYPAFVVLFGYILFKEDLPTVRQMLGGCLVFGGVLLILSK